MQYTARMINQEIKDKLLEHDERFRIVTHKLFEHDDQLKLVWEKLLQHDYQFERVWKKLLDHDERFEDLSDQIKGLPTREEFFATTDRMFTIFKRLDQEQVFTQGIVTRHSDEIEKNNADIRQIKTVLEIG